uniref:Uncharacterized protein n=1 Tax=Romanomermis culicivorax TaxID=13658 RepID=A0A915HY77_ROMCU
MEDWENQPEKRVCKQATKNWNAMVTIDEATPLMVRQLPPQVNVVVGPDTLIRVYGSTPNI